MQWNYLLIQSPVLQSWWINYLFPNIKHLLCFASVMLGVELSCFVVCLAESFSIALMNLRKCLMYSGYVSRLQCPPPFTHNGSYFSFESSQSRFPWDQSTISSFVPCTFIKLAGPHHPTTLKGGEGRRMDNCTYMYNQNGTWHQPYFVYVLKKIRQWYVIELSVQHKWSSRGHI